MAPVVGELTDGDYRARAMDFENMISRIKGSAIGNLGEHVALMLDFPEHANLA